MRDRESNIDLLRLVPHNSSYMQPIHECMLLKRCCGQSWAHFYCENSVDCSIFIGYIYSMDVFRPVKFVILCTGLYSAVGYSQWAGMSVEMFRSCSLPLFCLC